MTNFNLSQCKLSQTLIFLIIVFRLLGSSLAKAEVIFVETPSLTPPPLETPSLRPPKSMIDGENQQANPKHLGCKLITVCPKKKQLGCRTYLECPKK